jgi:DNA processing protein
VAGLSNAVVVVEADMASGTMITVGVAKKIKREVFAVAGSINSYASNAPNNLIKTQTARIITKIDDILDFFVGKQSGERETGGRGNAPTQISMDEKHILDILSRDEVHLDELLERCGLPINALMSLLTKMELSGLIEKLPQNFIVAK